MEVFIIQLAPYPYDPKRRDEAEKLQLTHLKEVKEKRDNQRGRPSAEGAQSCGPERGGEPIPHFHACQGLGYPPGDVCVLRKSWESIRPVAIYA